MEKNDAAMRKEAGLYKCVLFYYTNLLLPDVAWKQDELVLLNKRLERHASCRGLFLGCTS
jgi:hypothetical protein